MNNTTKIWEQNFGDTPCVGLDHPKFEDFMDALTSDCLAEEVQQLRKENKRLREAMEEILQIVPRIDAIPREEYDPHGDYTELLKINRMALAALNEQK